MAKKAKKKATKSADTEKSKAKATKKASKSAEKKVKKAKKKTKKVLAEEAAMNELEQRWHELHSKHGKAEAPQYKMSEVYQASTPIQHKILGWGFILTNENDRLEVLFEQGPKTLISNYKRP